MESNWPQRLIAHAFNLKVTAVNRISYQFKKKGVVIFQDNRHFNPGNPRKLPRHLEIQLCSHSMLQLHAGLSLKDRCKDIHRRFEIVLHPSSLREYYVRNDVKMRVVDLHSVNKFNRASEIQIK